METLSLENHKKLWSKEEIQILLTSGKSISELAILFNRTYKAVNNKKSDLRLEYPMHFKKLGVKKEKFEHMEILNSRKELRFLKPYSFEEDMKVWSLQNDKEKLYKEISNRTRRALTQRIIHLKKKNFGENLNPTVTTIVDIVKQEPVKPSFSIKIGDKCFYFKNIPKNISVDQKTKTLIIDND